ncbi:MAG TPA: cytochrome c oxidase subunit 3 family protein [Terriglobales bacterium]|nr:cytochrome c oxidase subunit 3 family protein [Terriglobales bacterium]
MATSTEVVAQHSLQHHFANMEQQRESSTLGMWIFLVTEILFFGGLFTAYVVYRSMYPDVWEMGSTHMEFWPGTINTIVLLCSSLTVALSVRAAAMGAQKTTALLLLVTVLMGFGFCGIKAYEYHHHWVEGTIPGNLWHYNVAENPDGTHSVPPHELQLFFFLYFVMTGLHALHVIIGMCILSTIAFFAWKGKYTPEYHNPVHISGLYWHFVDLVWIFLYPLLYLIANKHV